MTMGRVVEWMTMDTKGDVWWKMTCGGYDVVE